MFQLGSGQHCLVNNHQLRLTAFQILKQALREFAG
jgi:hypothetical protein